MALFLESWSSGPIGKSFEDSRYANKTKKTKSSKKQLTSPRGSGINYIILRNIDS
jgi:hypothetical protein